MTQETEFDLRTISENGLRLLRIVFQLQEYTSRRRKISREKRERAATLLNKIADSLQIVYQEIHKDDPDTLTQVSKIRVYMKDFKDIFAPLIGEEEAKNIRSNIIELFDGDQSEPGPMINGFIGLRNEHRDAVDSLHIQASIITLVQVKEQLEAISDVILASD